MRALAPARRKSHTVKGLVLRSVGTGIVYVPYQERGRGSWDACPLFDPNGVYVRDGYNIVVSKTEVETADEIGLSNLIASNLGACLCRSFVWDVRTGLCASCGHDAHDSRIHCGVMVAR